MFFWLYTDFSSWEDVDAFIHVEIQKCLEKFSNEMESMKKSAAIIITAISTYVNLLECSGKML